MIARRSAAEPELESAPNYSVIASRGSALGWGLRLSEPVIVGIVVVLVCVVYASFSGYGFDLLEEGYFATHARHVQLGGLPYRDFSTPYTPGVFYLYAFIMDWLGSDIAPLRWLQVAARAVLGVALYVAGRQLMPPSFAALPPIVIMLMDTVPGLWGLHPGWLSAPASALAIAAVARYIRDGRQRWLIGAGIAFGVGFVFKQNIPVFGMMAALWLLAVAEGHLPPITISRSPTGAVAIGRLSRVASWDRRWTQCASAHARVAAGATVVRIFVQVVAVALLPLTAAILVGPYWSATLAFLLVIPLLAVSIAAARLLVFRDGACSLDEPPSLTLFEREFSFYARPMLILLGFCGVTVPWLTLLVVALQGRIELLSVFVGNIDLTAYYLEIEELSIVHVMVVGAACLAPFLIRLRSAAELRTRGLATLGLGAIGGYLTFYVLRFIVSLTGFHNSWGVVGPAWSPYVEIAGSNWVVMQTMPPLLAGLVGPVQRFGTDAVLFLYLPTLAFWPALARLFIAHGNAQVGPGQLLRIWYLAAGSALLLNQFPRMDDAHMVWSGGILLIVGADVLRAWQSAISMRTPLFRIGVVDKMALRLSLLLLPAVAVLPSVGARLDGLPAFLSHIRGALAEVQGTAGAVHPQAYVPVALSGPGARVRAPSSQALNVQQVVEHLQQHTAPGEPIFAYPAIPGFYFLADRPNGTRFNHLFAGMASPEDQRRIVRQLEVIRYIVWDHRGAHFWVIPGINAVVTEYIRLHFRIEREFGLYTILSRDSLGPALLYHVPEPPVCAACSTILETEPADQDMEMGRSK